MALSADQLPDLDPDDPRNVSQQIAGFLRAAIDDGRLQPGDRLPSQEDFANRYGIARETVKSATRQLIVEGLLLSRQGSGVYVRDPAESGGPGVDELKALRADLEVLRAQLRRTDTDVKRVESRIDAVLNAWEPHGPQSTEVEVHPQ